MRYSKYRAVWFFILAAIPVIATIVNGPSPFVTLEGLPSVTGNITEKRITDYSGRHSNFHLSIYVWSKGSYYLSEPSRERINHYFDAVPTNGPITIHFRDDFGGHRIYDARDGDRIFISFNDIMAGMRRQQILPFVIAGLWALTGWFIWRRSSNRQKNVTTDYERPDHKFTPR